MSAYRLIALALALDRWYRRRARRRERDEALADAVALSLVTAAYARHGTDAELWRVYHRLHWGEWPR